ncbi:HAD family hydrolase [Marinimicrobium agarilyticum]|uniref:HAD family hydrolase n=1 Tax=Marinimicrobium agarilyticum TaxID=306546 RepID=UPI000418EF06|nr:HAD-IB family hydrolase [Marinimicrobium agarilyticum]
MECEQKMMADGAYAFFDVDDTLISVKSMFSFQAFWYDQTGDELGRARYEQDLRRHLHPGASWEFLNRLYYRHFAGRDAKRVEALGQAWFEQQRKSESPFYHARPLAELEMHQRQGCEVVFVSGSFPALLEPIARELGVAHILATRLAVEQGRYTGEILPPQTIGAGKAEAIGEFLALRQCSPESCFAYGDDISDLPMLQAVGRPTVVSGGRELEARARAMGWRVIAPV